MSKNQRPIKRSEITKLWPLLADAMPKSDLKVKAWTDGSACKQRFGGWAYHVEHGERFIQGSGGVENTTISRMEMEALRQLLIRLKPHHFPLEIRSDSQLVVNTFTKWIHGWKDNDWLTSTGKEVSNLDMVKDTWELLRAHREVRPVALIWIRGHTGERGNEICDKLCGEARLKTKELKLTSNG